MYSPSPLPPPSPPDSSGSSLCTRPEHFGQLFLNSQRPCPFPDPEANSKFFQHKAINDHDVGNIAIPGSDILSPNRNILFNRSEY